ncbi:polysaccharide deacetylase family protein [Pilimelia columellifera]|uniref:NodB homology domain-containing protein n=1 Tax=Pilimelia columellifera subsp. columellifera TaxID=706583 RepID=A0ABP6AVD3_9ACTN
MIRRFRRGAGRAPARPARPRSLRRSLAELVAALVALGVAAVLLVGPLTSSSAREPGVNVPVVATTTVDPKALINRCVRGKIALTFDDGPGPYTPAVLAVLRAYRARATFFVLGNKVSPGQDTLRMMVADGHVVGNHSWDHPHLADLTAAEIRSQLAETQSAITSVGVPAPALLRPPFGSSGPVVGSVARSLGLRVSDWTYDSEDWRGRQPQDIAAAVVQHARPGMVILLHDGAADATNTVRALPGIIEGLRARGFCTAALPDPPR